MLQSVVSPLSPGGQRRLTIILGVLTIAVAWLIIGRDWYVARSVEFSIAGFFPISDADGYLGCANGLLDLGHFGSAYEGWCGRRPLYIGELASILALVGRDLHAALLLQATLVSLAIVALAREAARVAGLLGALLVILVLIAFAGDRVFPVVATENAGLALGCLGLAFLLRGAETGGAWALYGGLALLSVALNARAGAFLILPMLVLWSGFRAWMTRGGIFRAMLCASIAVALGFAAELAAVMASGGALDQAHSNFAYTLYGLSVGGKTWRQIYLDHPEIFALASDDAKARMIYRLAAANIAARPGLILHALVANIATYAKVAGAFVAATFGIATRTGIGLAVGAVLSLGAAVPWLAGGAAAALRFREPRHSLIGFASLGTLLSAPFIAQDGDIRVFAASLPIDAVQMALGAAFLARLGRGEGRAPVSLPLGSGDRLPRLALFLALAVLALIAAPFTPLRSLAALPPLAAPPCAADEQAVAGRIGRDSVVLTLMPSGEAGSLHPARMPLPLLRRGLQAEAWYAPAFADPPFLPASYVLAAQRAAGAPDFGHTVHLVWPGDLAPAYGRTARFCYAATDPVGGQGLTYFRARSMAFIDDGAGR